MRQNIQKNIVNSYLIFSLKGNCCNQISHFLDQVNHASTLISIALDTYNSFHNFYSLSFRGVVSDMSNVFNKVSQNSCTN